MLYSAFKTNTIHVLAIQIKLFWTLYAPVLIQYSCLQGPKQEYGTHHSFLYRRYANKCPGVNICMNLYWKLMFSFAKSSYTDQSVHIKSKVDGENELANKFRVNQQVLRKASKMLIYAN